ncbi:family 16 glycosylhydrolase [Dyadobacter sp. CY356]|uniref:glycoside hydrolase family 16 protein n=1 Tax=Dyadobacter sp. CY356 TaxID=2906442 RepID=UPI0038D44D67
MVFRYTFLFFLILTISVSTLKGQEKLVWSDEFNIDGKPDPKNWKAEKGFVRNHEDQWYQAENAYCKNGFLIIEARKEEVKNPGYISGSKNWKEERETAHYTSASLVTQGMQSFKYGRFEMRARIDTRSGLWPAFWTLGNEGEWPDNGEIDIMEFYRGMLLANVAWGSKDKWKATWNSVKKPVSEFNDPEWASKFHIWRMNWDEKSIRLYVDDMLINTQEVEKTYNTIDPKSNGFIQPHYILVGMALGGDNGGDLSNTKFPARFEIDYVRVYQE